MSLKATVQMDGVNAQVVSSTSRGLFCRSLKSLRVRRPWQEELYRREDIVRYPTSCFEATDAFPVRRFALAEEEEKGL